MTVNFGTTEFATAWTIFAPSFAMPARSYCRPTMNPVMFWRKISGIRAQVAQLDEVRRLERGFREEDAVVRDDAHEVAVQPREARDEGRAVPLLELVEPRSVDETGDDLTDVVWLAHVRLHDPVDLFRIVARVFRRRDVGRRGLGGIQRGHDRPSDMQRVLVILGEVVGHP